MRGGGGTSVLPQPETSKQLFKQKESCMFLQPPTRIQGNMAAEKSCNALQTTLNCNSRRDDLFPLVVTDNFMNELVDFFFVCLLSPVVEKRDRSF